MTQDTDNKKETQMSLFLKVVILSEGFAKRRIS